jgi:hypothetical protein
MNTQAEAKYRAAQQKLAAKPDDLATLKEFAEAARGFDKRDAALDAMKAAYGKRPTPELYAELRSICTYPEFQAIKAPPESGAPKVQAGTGAELLPRKPFPLLLDKVIFYPVQDGLSVFILICCTILMAAGDLLRLAGPLGVGATLILWGVAYAYFWSVLHSSGMGERDTRGFPDFTDPGSLGTAVGQYFMVLIVCFGPAFLWLFLSVYISASPERDYDPPEQVQMEASPEPDEEESGEEAAAPAMRQEAPPQRPAVSREHEETGGMLARGLFILLGAIALFFLGVLYYPMALMLAGFTHSTGELFNLPAALRSIAKISGDYLICLGFFIGSYILVAVVVWVLNVAAGGMPWPLRIGVIFVGWSINTYLFIMQMRTAGLLYYAREKDLGWFQ